MAGQISGASTTDLSLFDHLKFFFVLAHWLEQCVAFGFVKIL